MAIDWYVENQDYNFFGVDDSRFKLDDQIFEVVEDPVDGYRSALEEVKLVNPDTDNSIFFNMPVDIIRVKDVNMYTDDKVSNFTGYLLCSEYDGHIWLYAGTEHWDDYYPSFCIRYSPREPYDKVFKV